MQNTDQSRAGLKTFAPKLALLATVAVTTVALTGCTTSSAPRADVSVGKAEAALQKGDSVKAVTHAEAAVLATPRDADARALLGTAYLEAGRFESAAQSFADAIELGGADNRTVLSYALANTAAGDKQAALEMLAKWEGSLNPADSGLALALAGNPQRGVFLLTNTLRSGQNTPKVRQNLAYTYALAGNWRAARVMAAEDVPADQIDRRLSDWAAMAKPEDYQVRVADMLGVAPVNDSGFPSKLALSNFPSAEQMMAEAETLNTVDGEPSQVAMAPSSAGKVQSGDTDTGQLTAARADDKVASLEKIDPTPAAKPAPEKRAAKVAAKSEKPAAGPRFVSNPQVQSVPKSAAPERVAKASTAKAKPAKAATQRNFVKGDTHLIQLGSFDSQAVAEGKWREFQRKFPQLKDHGVVITKAEVNGSIFYRVAAEGFARKGAASMCRAVKSTGRACFAYSKTNPPAGAIDSVTRVAAR